MAPHVPTGEDGALALRGSYGGVPDAHALKMPTL